MSTRVAPSPSLSRATIGARVARRLDADDQVGRIDVTGAEIYYQNVFLLDEECDELNALIDSNRRPSTLLGDRAQEQFRNSESCDLDRWSPIVRPIDERIAALLGIDPVQGETMQGQRYEPGQHFRAHQDYFHETESYYAEQMKWGGQRTWTAMVYLNDVEAGGETWFPRLGIKVQPARGLLLAWNNMALDGSPNYATTHEGCDVERGVKYIVTKWFREGRWLPK